MKTRIALVISSIYLIIPSQTPAQVNQPPVETYPQIVRISYVEGDVRINRGQQYIKETGGAWEKAVANLPLESGFSLVTGDGRAEIEFEDTSTLYLAENSVLSFNDLHTTGGVPYSDLALLAGTASFYIFPYSKDVSFYLRTPTGDRYLTWTPGNRFLRVSSYIDGVAFTSLDLAPLHDLTRMKEETFTVGQTAFYNGGYRIATPVAYDPAAFAGWDKWVAERVVQRTVAMNDVMKASGLTKPIPGLAEMNGQGTFFPCDPYGTCWEPNVAELRQKPGGSFAEATSSSVSSSGRPARSMKAASAAPVSLADFEDYFSCSPAGIRYWHEIDPMTGRDILFDLTLEQSAFYYPYSYNWALCHAGSWIYRHNHYVWVAGHKRHYRPPVRWVKNGRTVGFVPLHPKDVKGKPPINRSNGIFAVSNKKGLSVARVKFDPSHPLEALNTPPKAFSKPYLPSLSLVGEPRMETRAMKNAFSGNITANNRSAGIPINFDYKSQSFMMARQVMQGNRSVTVTAPLNNFGGNLQARGGGYSGSYSGSSGGTGHAGGGSSGGGGGHNGGGGGGGSSGGGGGHSGGGGGGGYSGGGSGSSGGSSGGTSGGSSSSSGGGRPR